MRVFWSHSRALLSPPSYLDHISLHPNSSITSRILTNDFLHLFLHSLWFYFLFSNSLISSLFSLTDILSFSCFSLHPDQFFCVLCSITFPAVFSFSILHICTSKTLHLAFLVISLHVTWCSRCRTKIHKILNINIKYSQTCIKRSSFRQRQSDLIRQVTS